MQATDLIAERHWQAMRARTVREAVALAIEAGNIIRDARQSEGGRWIPEDSGIPPRIFNLYANLATVFPTAESVCQCAGSVCIRTMIDDAKFATVAAIKEAVIDNDEQLRRNATNPMTTDFDRFAMQAKTCLLMLRFERLTFSKTTQ
jgi:hypothetical protein